MATSDANTTAIAIAPETSYGVLPGSPVFTELRKTGESIAHSKDTVISEEIRSDRQTPDMIKVGSRASGGINLEMSRDEYLVLFEALLHGTWLTTTLASVGGDINATAGTITATTPGDLADLPVGGYVKITGATTPANNGIKRVLSNNGNVAVFGSDSFTTNQTGGSFGLVTTQLRNGSTQRSFTLERRVINSLGADFFQRYSGMKVGGCNIAIESKKIITGSFEFLGKIGSVGNTTASTTGTAAFGTYTLSANVTANDTVTIDGTVYTFKAVPAVANEIDIGAAATDSLDNLIAAINGAAGAGTLYGTGTLAHPTVSAAAGAGDTMTATARTAGTDGNAIETTEGGTTSSWGTPTLASGASSIYVAPTINPILNGTSNVGRFDGKLGALTEKFKMLNFAVTNNLRDKDAIAEEGNFEVGLGTFGVTGRVSAYFGDNTLYASLIAHDDTSISILLEDDDGDMIGFSFPRVKFGTGNPNATAINTDIMLDIDFTAILDPASGKTMIISRFDA